ncbi:MAG: PhoX family phosphatase [Pseudomonadales bacterium]|nr:PhoX family phosphatase [Pseudomonadales bacterium]
MIKSDAEKTALNNNEESTAEGSAIQSKLMKHLRYHDQNESLDDVPNHKLSSNPTLQRRSFVRGGLGAAMGSLFLSNLSACNTMTAGITPGMLKLAPPGLGFDSVPTQTAIDFDEVVVADGYTAKPFFSWGDPVEKGAVPWRADATNTWQDQLKQAGQNHDGMHFFPFQDTPNGHGLLVVNHEYVNPTLHPFGFTENHDREGRLIRPVDEVKKEQAAHGVSIIEVKRNTAGDWQRVYPSSYNRRISALTPMTLSGPVAKTDLVKTEADSKGESVLGTINNCSMGWTPWGTYLTCEENWKNYFVNRDKADFDKRISHARYGISSDKHSARYGWESVDSRFDATPQSDRPYGGYVNEPNRFGWVVEIDPFDPHSTPIKRTAMGRLVRECAALSLGDDNRMAFYFGDDTRGEYIYKFVPSKPFMPGNRKANRDLLDEGTLYVAVFNDDGRGEWRALTFGEYGLTRRNGFANQADVLVNARKAADILGATTMDRPEWVAVHPQTREVYATLTNNKHRGVLDDQPINHANPRKENLHGQIIRWRESNADPTATQFEWDLFLLAGDDEMDQSVPEHLRGNIKGDLFSSPDGLWIDKAGRLWIETDYDDTATTHANMGTNQLLCADPVTKEVKRFLVGPRGCEITGITATPDNKTFWINIQHPGLSYPASDGITRARSTTLVITKNDGGVIGSM